jgi:hypothetical protein
MPGNGRKDISPMKSFAERGKKKFFSGNLIAFGLCVGGKDESKDAIVWPDEKMPAFVQNDGPPPRAHPRINDHHMDRPGGKVGVGISQDKSGSQHILRFDLVGHIDDLATGVDFQDGPLHRSGIFIQQTEVRDQSHNPGRILTQARFPLSADIVSI